jgi:signal transduction histidine kinase
VTVTTDTRSAPAPEAHALLGHELRTPLNALIGYADAMRRQTFGPLPPPYDEHAATIHGAAQHLLSLVNDMSDIARAEAGGWSGARERFDPRVLTDEVVTLLSPRALTAGVDLHFNVPDDRDDVLADRRAVTQILINLIDNALKFTAKGGEVRIDLAKEGGDLRLTVANTGASDGVPAAASPPKGMGIGLRLVRVLCSEHGGSLTIADLAEGGFMATVRLAVFPET